MTVKITGMEMPKSCYHCVLKNSSFADKLERCAIDNHIIHDNVFLKSRSPFCRLNPLKECK